MTCAKLSTAKQSLVDGRFGVDYTSHTIVSCTNPCLHSDSIDVGSLLSEFQSFVIGQAVGVMWH